MAYDLADDAQNRLAAAGYRPAQADETVRANRFWWDDAAESYLASHGDFLGADRFVWCPEGIDEQDAELLGPASALAGLDVLEVGCGAAQCARWLTAQGARVAATDLSIGMLRQGAQATGMRQGAQATGMRQGAGAGGSTHAPGLLQVDARRLPFADASFDLACSAYGAVPFVADPELVMAEVARVLRPGGRWVFSVTHPIRWAFPDDPGEGGLTATRSYFDRTPYVEEGEDGTVIYAEHHRTLGDRIRDVVRAGLVLEDLVEPEWPDTHRRVWGGWSPLRGERIPGTAIFVTRKPA